MKTAFIINPAAGRGKTQRTWLSIKRLLPPGMMYEEYYTHGPGHASQLAKKLEQNGIECIVVVAGDGTLHEVVNGLVTGKTILGLIPTGTGNDFCRSLGIPIKPETAVRILWDGRIKRLDLGCVNDKFFINVAGVGFDAHVAREVNVNFKWLSGTAAYLAAVFKLLFTYQNLPLKVLLDDNINLNIRSFLLAVGNARYYGGGMCIVPSAVLDDGYFHICVAGDVDRLSILSNLPKIFKGKHIEHPLVTEYKAKKVNLSSDIPVVIHADGEIVGYLPATLTLLPGRLKFLVPGK